MKEEKKSGTDGAARPASGLPEAAAADTAAERSAGAAEEAGGRATRAAGAADPAGGGEAVALSAGGRAGVEG